MVEVPSPTPAPTDVLVATRRSLLSSGTERAVRELAPAGLLRKRRPSPTWSEPSRKTARTDRIRKTVQTVRTRLDEYLPLSYNAAASSSSGRHQSLARSFGMPGGDCLDRGHDHDR